MLDMRIHVIDLKKGFLTCSLINNPFLYSLKFHCYYMLSFFLSFFLFFHDYASGYT